MQVRNNIWPRTGILQFESDFFTSFSPPGKKNDVRTYQCRLELASTHQTRREEPTVLNCIFAFQLNLFLAGVSLQLAGTLVKCVNLQDSKPM